jgi:hypothetical protein
MAINSEGGAWVPGEVWVPDGLHMAPAKDLPGIERALLFGSEHGTAGPTLFRANPEISDPMQAPSGLADGIDPKLLLTAASALAVGVVTTIMAIKHGPKIVTWWKEIAFPKLTSRLLDVLGIQRKSLVDDKTHEATIGPVSTSEFSREVSVIVDDLRETMPTEEARKRLLLVFVAASIISEQMWKLRNVRIKDEDYKALRAAMIKLTSVNVVNNVNEILGHRPSILDHETQAIFVEVFRGGRFVEGVFQPLTLEGIQEALRFNDRENDDPDEGGKSLTPA